MRLFEISRPAARWTALNVLLAVLGVTRGWGADTGTNTSASASSDPLLNLFIQKGFVTQEEAEKVKAEADFNRTNTLAYPPAELSKWKISKGTKAVELFGDVRLRYEDRSAQDPGTANIDLQRFRYSLRLGVRGDVLDDFYYGIRIETSANPRSSWVTMGTSSSGTPYQGPYGKSTAGIDVGQIYLGWKPEEWVNITLGKMPNPLYTTPMVWSGSLNPEGAAEQFKYTVGEADFFATFGQFLYAGNNTATTASGGLGINGGAGQAVNNIFQIAWEGGLTYHITPNVSAKIAATIYEYFGLQRSSVQSGPSTSPFFGDPYVGEGAYAGPGSSYPVYGASGYGTSSTLAGNQSLGYPNNQVGLNDLVVLEVPFEINFTINRVKARVFGDYAYNLEGTQRAQAASAGYAAWLASVQAPVATISTFAPQTSDVHAYQVGIGIGSTNLVYGPMQGLVYGNSSAKNAWELRTYWQHIEQYSLDPNILDTDFFEGNENLQGIYAAFAYGFSDNVIGTIRYGYASRINDKLGTGGTGQDIPNINPINSYSIFQVDVSMRF